MSKFSEKLISVETYARRTKYTVPHIYTLVRNGSLHGFKYRGDLLLIEKQAMKFFSQLPQSTHSRIGRRKNVYVSQHGEIAIKYQGDQIQTSENAVTKSRLARKESEFVFS